MSRRVRYSSPKGPKMTPAQEKLREDAERYMMRAAILEKGVKEFIGSEYCGDDAVQVARDCLTEALVCRANCRDCHRQAENAGKGVTK